MPRADELEKKLVADPFSLELRSLYAQALIHEGRFADALLQTELLTKQDASLTDILLLKVESLYELDRHAEARAAYVDWDRQTKGGQRKANEWDEIFGSANVHFIGDARRASAVPTAPSPPAPPKSSGVSFQDIVGMNDLKENLRLKIILPFQKPEIYAKFKKEAGGGILLYGPPGCGKTMFARAIATEVNAEFIPVGISEVLSMWIGKSESQLAAFFMRARAKRPSILFFDELDALAASRSRGSDSLRTLVNEFLMQLDGLGADNENILILAATNLPWEIDPAMKRHGRFARHVFLPPPDADARAKMFEMKLEGIPCDKISFASLASKSELYSGADIDGVIDYGKEKALERTFATNKEEVITEKDLLEGLTKITPTTREWITTMVNLVKYGGGDPSYADVEAYLKKSKFI